VFPISYENGGTKVTIFGDGTKIREVFDESLLPVHPESIDVKITDWCDAGCAYCHEKSTVKGKHADLSVLKELLHGLPRGAEIAIGGGHPLAHPEFDYFVTDMSDRGIVCNVTINEIHFKKEESRIKRLTDEGVIRGVGYSYRNTPCDFDYEHLVTHVIIGLTPYNELSQIARTNNKVLLLGYKDFGRGELFKTKHQEEVLRSIQSWYINLFDAPKHAHLSFDNLAITQLKPARIFTHREQYDQFYMGDDGTFTMYIDAVNRVYARSSVGLTRPSFESTIQGCFARVHCFT
jgi:hypothetical protein